MFKITRNNSTAQLIITVETDGYGTFEAVPLHPQEKTVNRTNMVVHCPGYEVLRVDNATGLYVLYERNGNLEFTHFD